MTRALKRVVITGMGAITPLGNSIEELWRNLVAGKSGIILPTIYTTEVEPAFANRFNLTLQNTQRRKIKYALNNTFGFGGHLASSIFQEV